MRIEARRELPHWIVLGLMFGLAALAWPTAPEEIPVHWNLHGEVDRYGGRFEGLLLLPLIALGNYLLLLFIPRIDPRHRNYAGFAGVYSVIRLAILVFLALLYGAMHLWMRGIQVDIGILVGVSLGGMLALLGWFLPRVLPNWFVGIRTPWTLSSEVVWRETHAFGGRVFLVTGLLVMLSAVLLGGKWGTIAMMTLLLASSALVIGYSYWAWRRVEADRA